MAWQPILEGELADRARAAARGIATALADHATPVEDLALYWAYTAAVHEDLEACFDAAADRLATRIAAGYHHPALYGGAAGAGFVTAHVAEDVEPLLAAIDTALLDRISIDPWRDDYDLIRGLVGYGVYFLERGDRGRAGLDRVLDQLARSAIASDDRLAWHTAPELLPEHQRVDAPAGYWNCGLAHGIPGVVALAARAGDHPVAARLRDGAARWLHAQRIADGWPATVIDGQPRRRSRTAWCYGDPGVLVALYRAAPSTELVELAVATFARSLADTRVADAGLCHGAAGLAHLANRFFHATRDARFRDLARVWYSHALDYHVPGEGIGGFRAWNSIDKTWFTTAALLEGASGIGLALQAAITDVEPRWDRLLLCDLPGSD